MKSPHYPVAESFFYSFKRQVSNMTRLKLSVIIQPLISGFLKAEAKAKFPGHIAAQKY